MAVCFPCLTGPTWPEALGSGRCAVKKRVPVDPIPVLARPWHVAYKIVYNKHSLRGNAGYKGLVLLG